MQPAHCLPLHRAPADNDADLGQRLANLVARVAVSVQPVDLRGEGAHLAALAAGRMLGLELHGDRRQADAIVGIVAAIWCDDFGSKIIGPAHLGSCLCSGCAGCSVGHTADQVDAQVRIATRSLMQIRSI